MKNTGNGKSRRNFLSRILAGWLALVLLPAVYVIIKYIIPPKLREAVLQTIFAGKMSDIPVNSYKIVRYNKKPIIIIHTETGEIKAFSAACTHLGCIVDFEPENKRFHCNCHDSLYDLNGMNYSGPAQKPLAPYRVTVKDNDISISAT
jgi:cytochrome b6-f complex iron-sulfur subunit